MIRKATPDDIGAVAQIYESIHKQERQKKICVGWIAGVYPTRATAEKALARRDLFVYEKDGRILASAIINQEQVDVYVHGNWRYKAAEREIMVLHTLAVEPSAAAQGIGRAFASFYEEFARGAGCKVLQIDTNARNTVARQGSIPNFV